MSGASKSASASSRPSSTPDRSSACGWSPVYGEPLPGVLGRRPHRRHDDRGRPRTSQSLFADGSRRRSARATDQRAAHDRTRAAARRSCTSASTVGTELTIATPDQPVSDRSPCPQAHPDRRRHRHHAVHARWPTQLEREGPDLRAALRHALAATPAPTGRCCRALYGHRVRIYCDDTQPDRLPLTRPARRTSRSARISTSAARAGMIDWVLKAARQAGWPDENVHSERFLPPPPATRSPSNSPSRSARSKSARARACWRRSRPPASTPPFLCRGGACGQCETAVVSCDGALEHNDHYLSDEEKASGRKIMICVSRFEGAANSCWTSRRRRGLAMGIDVQGRDVRDDFTFSNSPRGDPALSVPVRRRQVHVRGQHRAAHAGAAKAPRTSSRSTSTSTTSPRCRTARWC